MVPAKRKDRAGHSFFRHGDIFIRLEFLNDLIQRHWPLDFEVEPDAMHVLRVQLNRRRKEIQIETTRVEQMPGILGVMCAKLGIFMFTSLWSCNKALFLANITGAPHTDKAAFEQVVGGFVMQGQGFREHSEVMGVTTDNLDETIFPRHQGRIVDATRIGFAKAKLASLGEKTFGFGMCWNQSILC